MTPRTLTGQAQSEVEAWEIARTSNSSDVLHSFLKQFPTSDNAIEARELITDLSKHAWEHATKADLVDIYRVFLLKYPESAYSKIAAERLNSKLVNTAKITANYPAVIEPTIDPDRNYTWDVEFVEQGCQSGVTLVARWFTVSDLAGLPWRPSTNYEMRLGGTRSVTIPACSKTKVSFTLTRPNKWTGWLGGSVLHQWSGTDDVGNAISVEIRIALPK